jgi:hypothetical protein
VASYKKQQRVLLSTLIVFIVLSFYLYKGYNKRSDYIEIYHNSIVTNSQNYIAMAYGDFMYGIEFDDNSNATKKHHFIKAAHSLDVATRSIGMQSIYYTFNSGKQSYGGNSTAMFFFRPYIEALQRWSYALEDNNEQGIPTPKDIEDMAADLKNITDKFQCVFENDYVGQNPINQLSYEGLYNIFKTLVSETRLESAKMYFNNSPHFPN